MNFSHFSFFIIASIHLSFWFNCLKSLNMSTLEYCRFEYFVRIPLLLSSLRTSGILPSLVDVWHSLELLRRTIEVASHAYPSCQNLWPFERRNPGGFDNFVLEELILQIQTTRLTIKNIG